MLSTKFNLKKCNINVKFRSVVLQLFQGHRATGAVGDPESLERLKMCSVLRMRTCYKNKKRKKKRTYNREI